MKIVCLGWGSLIWDPRNLLVNGSWLSDGPLVPVDFLRKSSDGRITLVLDKSAKPVPSLWIEMKTNDLEEARRSLGKREYENASISWIDKNIGTWIKGDNPPELIPALSEWASLMGVDAVVWTALPCKHPFTNEERVADQEEVLKYIKSLTGTVLKSAKLYIRNAPIQIMTNYRSAIEQAIGDGT